MMWIRKCICLLLVCASLSVRAVLEKTEDLKELKKILRTKNNVLVCYANGEIHLKKNAALLNQLTDEVYGEGTVVGVDCSSDEGRKLCKKMKANPKTFSLKHYHSGEYNKDYDRKLQLTSLVSFMKDPKGDEPWDEDDSAKDVQFLKSPADFKRITTKQKLPVLVMFYAPWCGHCKRMKPDYAAAATELKSSNVLAALDASDPANTEIAKAFNISGYPTLLYFKDGKLMFPYAGKNNQKESIIEFMKNPSAPKQEEKEKDWAEETSEVQHLTDDNFHATLAANPSVLVMFYAPWCGHCKAMKPEYTEAAKTLTEAGIAGVLAAVDATQHKVVAAEFEVKGYPSVKYFLNGAFAFDFTERTASKIVDFMKDPKEPPPPPPPEPAWEDAKSDVVHLNSESFNTVLKKRKHALVMFYAPWCGHCKMAKPKFETAAAKYTENVKVMFGAVDCTKHTDICQEYDVSGYPTLLYFSYLKDTEKYGGARDEDGFIGFMEKKLDPNAAVPSQPPAQDQDWTGPVELLDSANFDEKLGPVSSALVMFYAPWCGHCKRAKPEFGEAAKEFINDSGRMIAAVDCTVAKDVCETFDVSGYPTFKQFSNGAFTKDYNGGRTKTDFVRALKPDAIDSTPDPTTDAFDSKHVAILTDSNFDETIREMTASLVMFYAPWCGHCKKAKPDFAKASDDLAKSGKKLLIGAVDCTQYRDLCQKFDVSGYPTFKLFRKAELAEGYAGGRTAEAFVAGLQYFADSEAKESEKHKADDDSNVEMHLAEGFTTGPVPLLNDFNFVDTLTMVPIAMVMFYIPGCPACEKAKPDFGRFAKSVAEKPVVAGSMVFAVDCKLSTIQCGIHNVEELPTFKLFIYGQHHLDYHGKITRGAFLDAMRNAVKDVPERPPEPLHVEEIEDTDDTPFFDSVVSHLDDEALQVTLPEYFGALVLFYKPADEKFKELEPIYLAVAGEIDVRDLADEADVEVGQPPAELFVGKRLVAAVNCELDAELCNSLSPDTPSIKIYINGKYEKVYSGEMSKASLLAALDAAVKEGSERKDSFANLVVDQKDLEEIIARVERVMVMFFDPGCAQCAKMKPSFATAANQFANAGDLVAFRALDCTKFKEFCKEKNIEAYPTINIYLRGQFLKVYDQQATLDSLLLELDKTADILSNPPDPGRFQDLVYRADEVLALLPKSEMSVIMYLGPNCPKCEDAKPALLESAMVLTPGGVLDKAFIGAVDCEMDAEMCRNEGVPELPALFLYFGSQYHKYQTGPITSQGILELLLTSKDSEGMARPNAGVVGADDFEIYVERLTSDNFTPKLAEYNVGLVMFYAPWCGHCKQAKPDFAETAKFLTTRKSRNVLGSVDCTKELELCKKESIKGYPTFKVYEKGVYLNDFTGSREKDGYLSALMAGMGMKTKKALDDEKAGVKIVMSEAKELKDKEATEAAATGKQDQKDAGRPSPEPTPEKAADQGFDPAVVILTKDSFEAAISGSKNALVMFYAPWCGHCKKAKPAFGEAAAAIKAKHGVDSEQKIVLAAVDCTVEKELCQQHSISGYPSIYIYENGKFLKKFQGAREKELFMTAVEQPNSLPTPEAKKKRVTEVDGPFVFSPAVRMLTADTLQTALQPAPVAMVMFYAPWCGHCKKAKPEFGDAATEVANSQKTGDAGLVFGAVDCTVHKDLCKAEDVKSYPTIKMFKKGELLKLFKGDRNKEGFLKAIRNPDSENVKTPSVKEFAFDGGVKVLDSSNFAPELASSKAAVIMFFAPWCGHCKKAKPAFGELAKEVADGGHGDWLVGAVDCTIEKDVCAENKAKGFPTFNIYVNGKYKEKYSGARDKDSLLSALTKAAGEASDSGSADAEPSAETPPAPFLALDGFSANVKGLTKDSYAALVKRSRAAMIMFFAPWCGHCKSAKSDYSEAADEVARMADEPLVYYAAVDCTQNEDLCTSENIDGYPTFKIFINGQFKKDHSGARNKKGFVDALLLEPLPPAVKHEEL